MKKLIVLDATSGERGAIHSTADGEPCPQTAQPHTSKGQNTPYTPSLKSEIPMSVTASSDEPFSTPHAEAQRGRC